jgi:lipid-A-disaccharide synthase
MSARSDVRRELVRAVLDAVVAPLRAGAYLLRRGALEAEVRADLAAPAAVEDGPAPSGLPDRPLRILVSCAEPSGEQHARNLVRALRAELEAAGAPPPELVGLGSDRLGALGVRLLGDPVSRAAMGADAARQLSFYTDMLRDVAAHLADPGCDLVLPVDSPALHVPLGRIARRHGARVAHFVTPQYWGWAPWRVGGYRGAVDLALSILPFEPAWFRRRRVPTAHVGHPIVDALAEVPAAASAGDEDDGSLVLLPGSRASVVERNLPWMLTAAARLRLAHPDLRVVLPYERGDLRDTLQRLLASSGAAGWVELVHGRLHDTLRRARCALSVSGTVLLDLLHHRLPAVVVYRLPGRLWSWARPRFLTVPWFASTNLLASRELLPEFCFHGEGPFEEACAALERCYGDPEWRGACRAGLEEVAARLGPAGATRRAARHALGLMNRDS